VRSSFGSPTLVNIPYEDHNGQDVKLLSKPSREDSSLVKVEVAPCLNALPHQRVAHIDPQLRGLKETGQVSPCLGGKNPITKRIRDLLKTATNNPNRPEGPLLAELVQEFGLFQAVAP
jgi:hypothetical protein